jgi:hypothetical protein
MVRLTFFSACVYISISLVDMSKKPGWVVASAFLMDAIVLRRRGSTSALFSRWKQDKVYRTTIVENSPVGDHGTRHIYM